MLKTIRLALNKYVPIPTSLLVASGSNTHVDQLQIDPARLFHHYYLDTRGYAPPSPDPAQFEHLTLFLPNPEIRVRGDGFGTHKAFRQHRSNELGQAFCRWFLYENLGITYFAHMESVLNRGPKKAFGGVSVERVASGDAPDYFCAGNNVAKVFLAEAKARTSAISFTNREFGSWRRQFERVVVKESSGELRSVKGHIVATRFATEEHRSTVKSTLFAEDPNSPGEKGLGEAPELGRAILAHHYAEMAAKIRQPLLAASLSSGVPVPPEIRFPGVVWELQAGPQQGMRFIGGYFPGTDGIPMVQVIDGKPVFMSSNPFRLDLSAGTFVGVEENIFREVCGMARQSDALASQVRQLPEPEFYFSGLSMLRDGSVIGPVGLFNPIGNVTY